jgi:chromosome segregation ATPase
MTEGNEDAEALRREVAELRAELERRDAEIVRLRDLLVARDAELGSARGRLRYYERRFPRVRRTIGELRAGAPVSGVAGKVARKLLDRR